MFAVDKNKGPVFVGYRAFIVFVVLNNFPFGNFIRSERPKS